VELVQSLASLAEPWERARAAWSALRAFEAELPVKNREVAAVLRDLKNAIKGALGPGRAA
jgi:hypothetical protein